jgi:4-amino-4-deoxy-L-arabinose transferase-like glycosyltransferase
MNKKSIDRSLLLIPGLLLLFSFWLRLALLNQGPYHLDCLNLAIQAEKTLTTKQLQPLFGFGYPFVVILGAFFIKITQFMGLTDSVFAVNLMSAVFGSLCVPACYFFCKKAINEKAALFSSILLSLNPLFLSLSTFGMSHTPTLFFLFLGLLAILEFKQTNKKQHLLLAGIFLGFMGACRFQDLILMLVPIYFLFLVNFYENPFHSKKKIKESLSSIFLFSSLIILIAVLFHLPYLFSDKALRYNQGLRLFFKMGVTNNFSFFAPHIIEKSLGIITYELFPIGILCALIGFILLRKNLRPMFIFLLLWFIVPTCFYGNIFTVTARLLLLALIPFLLAMGYTFSYLFQSQKHKIPYYIIFLLTSLLPFSYSFDTLYLRHQHSLLIDYAKWLASVTEPQAIIVSEDDFLSLQYYGKRQIYYWPVNFYQGFEEQSPFKSWLDKMLVQKTPIYIRFLLPDDYAAFPNFIESLNANYQLKFIGAVPYEDWHNSTTVCYILSAELFKIEKKVN